MGDWLGTGYIATHQREYRSFNEAREFARSLDLRNGDEWTEFCKGNLPDKGSLPQDIPAGPYRVYAEKGWQGFGDWLGTGNIAPRYHEYRSFNNAREFARSLGLKSGAEWSEFCNGNLPEKGKLPADIPANPYSTYADKGWTGIPDWLGTKLIKTNDK